MRRLVALSLAALVLSVCSADTPAVAQDVFAKALEWSEKHEGELRKPASIEKLERARATTEERLNGPGTTIRGYVSKVDGSVQPYALTLPKGFDPKRSKRWPLVVKLHGRANTMNELEFVARHDGRPPEKGQDWIQLEPYGRGNNAFRWAGETDVFEAIEDVAKQFRIDRRRITLWGFSMGGAGAWHLGMHHPSKWVSVGAGAGFVDFYEYQNQKERRPPWQHATLGIYDAKDYALNAFNVPTVGYGGEKDKQLAAAKTMVAEAEKLDVPVKLIVGAGAGHKFTPEASAEFQAFLAKPREKGQRAYPGNPEIRFTTRTLKYNQCHWLTIEELVKQYEPATVESKFDSSGELQITTKNVAILQIARDLADRVVIDGDLVPLSGAADGLLPGVYYEHNGNAWFPLTYEDSKDFYQNQSGRKRPGVQGPIDDAFTGPFVCVRGTGEPWSKSHQAWSDWTLNRFENEWSKWMRGELPVIDDEPVEVVEDDEGRRYLEDQRNLILFGDPGSNKVIAQLLKDLPIEWTPEKLVANGETYDPNDHAVSLIFPNPLDKRFYVVLNSGHTFHEKDFRASNSWLFPRLGDIAVQRFEKTDDGFAEETVWADIFNGAWRLPPKK